MADSTPIRQSELHSRLVIDLETTEEIGKLDHFVVDIKTHQVEGFICRQGFLGQERTPVTWVQVETVGRDSILVRQSGSSIPERFDDAIPVTNQAVWTDAGEKIGHLADYCIDLQTGAVTQYLFMAPGWQGFTDGLYTFSPAAVVSAGQKRMMVRQTALENAQQYVPGVQDRIADTVQEDYDQTRKDVQGAIDNTRAVAEQVQQQTQQLTEKARSQFGQVFGKVKQQSKHWRSQINERVADVAANLQPADRNQSDPDRDRPAIDVDSEELDSTTAAPSEAHREPSDTQRE